jgi:benzoyl-CoA reductase subunit BamC
MCLQEPPLDEPLCVTWCTPDALTYEEVEEEGEEEKPTEEKDYAMDYLIKQYGWQEIKDTFEKLSKSKS